MNYSQKLKDPRWQKMRLKIMERDNWKCRECGADDKTLNVHHTRYSNGFEPWEYPTDYLITLCEDCHREQHGLTVVSTELGDSLKLPKYQSRKGIPQEEEEMLNFLLHLSQVGHNFLCCIESIFYDSKANICCFTWTPQVALLREEEKDAIRAIANKHIRQFEWLDGCCYGEDTVHS